MWNDVVLDNTPPEAGCSWPIVTTCDPPDDDAVRIWTEQMAIEILWAASGRQYGLCVSTVRPVSRLCNQPYQSDAWSLISNRPRLLDPREGSLFGLISCGCSGTCCCPTIEAIDLFHDRPRSIIEVAIDGEILDPTAYRLSKGQLIRVDGGVWPLCQDWNVDADQPGGWYVKYVHGRPVPWGGRVSAGILSAELQKAVCNDDENPCALPRRTQTIVRAGATIGFLDPMQFIDEGKTGLYEVDLWLQKVNPNRLQRRSRVYRADDPRRPSRSRR